MDNSSLNIVFFGNNLKILEYLDSIVNIVAVFTRPNNGSNDSIDLIERYLDSKDILLFQPTKKELYMHSPFLKNEDVDLIIVCGYKYIIPREIFSLPKSGAINIHPSMLPKYRGQHVINWAIVNGETKTGVTVHFVDDDLDTGDIIAQRSVPIYFDDTAKQLHDRIYDKACYLLKDVLNDFSKTGQFERKVQDSSNATFFKPRKPEDGHLDWSKSSIEVYNIIRALSKPWPGAFSYFNGSKIIFWEASIDVSHSPKEDYPCGSIIKAAENYLLISTIDGMIAVNKFEVVPNNAKTKKLTFIEGNTFT
ncbi:methionyl-tRNA formyltransferase [Methanolobus profundi]|uniref:Methionyl-tRNA formyltransferase n=1 Tax=Methanolobus profundi TaxID=487685 RepID=A0A1I4RY07_9EURY|nr:methionyl-tRNA formyltransferase [Methanolobus profundi]SFM56843.1 methionyl-tRNA formyltransferase [Methanolobus profundi]